MFSIVQLLPQSPETQIPTHLKCFEALSLIFFLTKQTLQAFEAFYIEQKLYEFDPHVGETSCQIRAYQVLLLSADRNLNQFAMYNKVNSLKSLINKMGADLDRYKVLDTTRRNRAERPITLTDFIHINGYYFELLQDEFFLVLARFLTVYKYELHGGEPEINYKKLIEDSGLSKTSARRLIHIFQMKLSEISCDFVLKLAETTSTLPFDWRVLRDLKEIDDDGRHVLPCYWVMKVIYLHMLQTKKIILLSISGGDSYHFSKTTLLPFVPSKHTNSYQYTSNLSSNLLSQGAYVIQGVINADRSKPSYDGDYIQCLLANNIQQLIFWNMAGHPQYSGLRLKSLSENPFSAEFNKNRINNYQLLEQEFLFNKRLANQMGCCLTNQSLFYIKHIYCDTFNRQISLAEKTHDYLQSRNNSELNAFAIV